MLKKENSKQTCNTNSKVIFFATSNMHKFNEAKSILSPLGYAVAMLKVKGDEIQSESLKEIAKKTAINAFKKARLPIFVEDAGLFIDALSGFPGPYAAYVYKTIHNGGVVKLMDDKKNRKAIFQSVIAYLDETLSEPKIFSGESKGEITALEQNPAGKTAFGFDPIFKPSGTNKTFAEMTIDEKNTYSHRAVAIRKFVEWYKSKPA